MASTPRSRRLALTLLTLSLATGLAQAAGYRFGTQSAAAEGTANANGAEGADASTLFANPAAMTRLGKGWQVSGVLDHVAPDVQFTDAGSFISLPGSGFKPVAIAQAGSTQNAASGVFVPHLYAAYRASDSLAYGLGVFVPSGAKLDYAAGWGGRYNLNRVELKSLAFNPNVAWKLNSQLSLAAGLNVEYMQGELQRATPYASVYAAGLLAAAQQAAAGGAPGLALQLQQQAAQVFGNPAFDGSIHVQGKGWALGFNLALLWELDAKTRFGLAYRSSVSHRLKGDADWTQPANLPAQVLAAITAKPSDGHSRLDHNDSGASLRVKTPESLSFQAFRQLDERMAVMADATWYRQSRLKELRIEFDSTAAPSITREQWKNAWRISLGGSYRLTPDLLLRTGISYDRSPVDGALRSPALPDSDRTWLALGANIRLATSTTLDLSVGFVKLRDAPMQATDDAGGELPCSCAYSTVRGNYRSSAATLGVQLNHGF